MAITWGAYEDGNTPGNDLRVGIDISVSGSTATVKYYVGTSSTGAYGDNQTMNYSGSITGSTDFFNSTGNSDTQLVATKTKTVSPGSTYTFAASISGAYNGATPSHSRKYTDPVDKPSAPTGLNASTITSDGMTLKWTQPSNWGGNDTDDYTLQYATNSSFSGVTSISVSNATTKVVTGLDSGQLYYWRVAAKNSAGTGSYSTAINATTLTGSASAPQNVVVSNIGPSSARVAWTYPADDGGSPITSWDVQVSRNADFSDPTTHTGVVGSPYIVPNLVPNSQYYVRVRGVNSAGVGLWSDGVPFKTLAGAKVVVGGVLTDVPSLVMVGGVFTPVAPQKMVAGVWTF